MHNPSEQHLEVVYIILHYLKGISGKGIFFSKSQKRQIEILTYANWEGCSEDRWSTSAYCTFVWGNLVTWMSKKRVVAQSSAEARYRAMARGVCEVIWVRSILWELKIWSRQPPSKLFCDNKSTINIAHNPFNMIIQNMLKSIDIPWKRSLRVEIFACLTFQLQNN